MLSRNWQRCVRNYWPGWGSNNRTKALDSLFHQPLSVATSAIFNALYRQSSVDRFSLITIDLVWKMVFKNIHFSFWIHYLCNVTVNMIQWNDFLIFFYYMFHCYCFLYRYNYDSFLYCIRLFSFVFITHRRIPILISYLFVLFHHFFF